MENSDVQLFRAFNPGLAQTDAEIVDQFVVRHKELRVVIDTIKENMASDTCQHILIIGQRGSGKSMLLARVAAELRTNSEFEGLIPVRFSEESDEVIDATSFWLEALRQVVREIEASNPQLADDTNATIQDLSDRWQDSTAEEQAQTAVLRLVQRLDSKVVLMVENLQSLFENTDESFGWKLREVLQSSSRLALIGTATLRFKSMDRFNMPFFEFFRVVHLAPLDLASCQELWNKITQKRFPSRQIRPLEILTGGNPRLLVVTSNLAFHDSLKQLMDELIRLIDHHTEYFRSRLEEIPTKERIVFLSMLDLWRDSTLKEISTRARMGTQSVSGLLNRLALRGLVSKEGSGRKHLYSVNERLFCFYYKLRNRNDGVAVVEHLVNFMVSFYSGSELRQIREGISEEAKTTSFILDGLLRAKENFRFYVSNDAYERDQNATYDAHKSIANLLWVNEILESSMIRKDNESRRGEASVVPKQNVHPKSLAGESQSESILETKLTNVTALTNQHEYGQALEILGEVLSDLDNEAIESEEALRAHVVFQIGELSSIMERRRDSSYSFDYIVDHFNRSDEPVIRKLYVETLKSQAAALAEDNLVDEGIEKLKVAIAYVINLDRLGTLTQDGILSWEDIFHIQMQQGILLRESGRLEESLVVLNEILESDLTQSTPDRHQYVRLVAQIERGITLRDLGSHSESLRSFEDAIETVASNGSTSWTSISIRAYREMATTQLESDPAIALNTLKDAIRRANASDGGRFDLELARLIAKKASIEVEYKETDAALATWSQIYDRFHDTNDPSVCSVVCDSLFEQGAPAFQQEQWAELKLLSKRLTRLSRMLPNIPIFDRNRFDALFVHTVVLVFVQENQYEKALTLFKEICAMVEKGSTLMLQGVLVLTQILLHSVINEADLISVLSGGKRDDVVLRPLVVALRMRIGDDIREPREVREVANDVYREIYGK